MPEPPEIREELADERRELKNAVADLRGELDETAEQGKKLAVIVGAATGGTGASEDRSEADAAAAS